MNQEGISCKELTFRLGTFISRRLVKYPGVSPPRMRILYLALYTVTVPSCSFIASEAKVSDSTPRLTFCMCDCNAASAAFISNRLLEI